MKEGFGDGTYSHKILEKGGSPGEVPKNWILNNKNSIHFGQLIHYQEYKYYR
jgi:hypothetical protein